MIIGLTGRAGSGKDSAAAALVATGHWRSIAFADDLRNEVAQAWVMDPRAFTDRATKEQPTAALALWRCTNTYFLAWASACGHDSREPRSPRQIMQWWGDFRRGQSPDYFVVPVRNWVRLMRARFPTQHIVVTDVRMPNEWAMLRAHYGKLVRVHRPGLPPMVGGTRDHASEQHTTLVASHDVHNDGTLQALAEQIIAIADQIGTGAEA